MGSLGQIELLLESVCRPILFAGWRQQQQEDDKLLPCCGRLALRLRAAHERLKWEASRTGSGMECCEWEAVRVGRKMGRKMGSEMGRKCGHFGDKQQVALLSLCAQVCAWLLFSLHHCGKLDAALHQRSTQSFSRCSTGALSHSVTVALSHSRAAVHRCSKAQVQQSSGAAELRCISAAVQQRGSSPVRQDCSSLP